MATEASSMPVNGNYAQSHGYEQQSYGAQQSYSQAPTNSSATTNGNSDIPKDEVGWYFVEQYYTTLSKQPEHLYLYYNKRSQFVSGSETDKVPVCIGQRAINDRIKELDFQDCKVRITNVDSQASDVNIVIQVIGEISNKSQPHRKFTQTFVLATQTNGYFVLNDIFRYIIEEEDEMEPQAEAETEAHNEDTTAAAESVADEPKTLTSSSEAAAVEHDAQFVDKVIEKKLSEPTPEVNGSHADEDEIEISKAETSDSPERPTEPEPTPAPSPPKQAAPPPQPAAAPKPAIPKTWASMAASANKSNTVKVPVPAVPQKSAGGKPAAPVAPPPASPVPSNAAPAQAQEIVTSESQDEWTAVGNHNRQQSRQVTAPQNEGPQRKAYIKNVTESIQEDEIRDVLVKFGKITKVEIVRARNCAFVDFEAPEAYQAAVAANPHTIGSASLFVDERKIRPAGNAPQRGQFQGGRGRGDVQRGRGGFNQRGRGQGQAARGRGGPQQA